MEPRRCHLSEDPGPHAVFFPVCEGLERAWDTQGGGRRHRRAGGET